MEMAFGGNVGEQMRDVGKSRCVGTDGTKKRDPLVRQVGTVDNWGCRGHLLDQTSLVPGGDRNETFFGADFIVCASYEDAYMDSNTPKCRDRGVNLNQQANEGDGLSLKLSKATGASRSRWDQRSKEVSVENRSAMGRFDLGVTLTTAGVAGFFRLPIVRTCGSCETCGSCKISNRSGLS